MLIVTVIAFSLENDVAPSEVGKESILQSSHVAEKCSQGKFLTVAELSSATDKSSGLAAIDMVYIL